MVIEGSFFPLVFVGLAVVALGVLSLVLAILWGLFAPTKPERVPALIGMLGVVIGFYLAFMGSISLGGAVDSPYVNNPVAYKHATGDTLFISEDALEEQIAQAGDLAGVKLTDKYSMHRGLFDGDFAEFTSSSEGERIFGRVYFTEDEMVLKLSGEDDAEFDKEIRVETK